MHTGLTDVATRVYKTRGVKTANEVQSAHISYVAMHRLHTKHENAQKTQFGSILTAITGTAYLLD
jgi:hypothetical protein